MPANLFIESLVQWTTLSCWAMLVSALVFPALARLFAALLLTWASTLEAALDAARQTWPRVWAAHYKELM